MAGYYNYSMSNNAVSAYECGERPLSKWMKKDIIKTIGKDVIDRNPQLKALKAKELKAIFLTQDGWHHTSKFYNETNFYACRTLQEVAEDPDACAIDVAVTWPHFPMGEHLTQKSPEVVAYYEEREKTIAEMRKLHNIADAIAAGTIK